MASLTLHTAESLDNPTSVAYDTALSALHSGQIEQEHGIMRWGSNYTFLVTVTCAEARFMAIYKPRIGERPLWDFPDGTLCQREAAAFVVSEALGWHIVPPTILRDGPRGAGSVQVFIDHDPQQHYFTLDEETHDAQLRRIAAFDMLVNNADRKGGHCLVDADDRIWCIDHGLTFHTMHKLRTVIWDYAGQAISAEIMTSLEAFCVTLDDVGSDCMRSLGALLSDVEIKALRGRLNTMLKTGIYASPGPGPNRPWPAV